MPRNMSFALTIPQILDGSKTLTRRDGWANLKPGELLWAVDKAMGFKAGEHPTRLKLIWVRATRWEPLRDITQEDMVREGFPDWTPEQFISFYCAAKKGRTPDMLVNRIDFRHMRLDPEMPVAVPVKLAVCPMCGGKLSITACDAWEEAEPGLMKPTEITTACEHEPDIEDEEWLAWHAWHYNMPYVDWLPVDKRVLRWFQHVSRYTR